MTECDERGHFLTLGDFHDLGNLGGIVNTHNNRAETERMRGQAEGLCGDARIKGLPVSGKRGTERAVALVAGLSVTTM